MGRNLALNLAGQGNCVALYDPWPEVREAFTESSTGHAGELLPAASPEAFVAALARPRRVILLVKAGPAVDGQIAALTPLLEAGDLIADAGNSHHRDSARRGEELSARGLHFLGIGLSGGEAGARRGASLMVGGSPEAYGLVEGVLQGVAARADGEPCCARLGGAGAGHFVKMLHNGIEYAAMQLIAEAYMVMERALGLDPAAIGALFGRWNRGPLESYLTGITAEILAHRDPASGKPLVGLILDKAGQKGTGLWAASTALELGVAAPTLAEAVSARALSLLKQERLAAQERLPGPSRTGPGEAADGLPEALEQALLASMVCVYAQGFAVMAAGAREYGWDLDLGRAAAVWRNGSILRARLLDAIVVAYGADPGLANLLLAPGLSELLARAQDGWRRSAAFALSRGLPAPAICSALGYYDAYRSGRLPANLIQAQRDFFGAHGFERTDRAGSFHVDWGHGDGPGQGGGA
jgi:6-phosphogluconate dehydrogenase